MARPNYHRDLLGTVLAVCGLAMITAIAVKGLDREALGPVLFGLSTILAVWLAKHVYVELRAGEAAVGAAIAVLVVASISRWYDLEHLDARVLVYAGIEAVCAMLGVWIAFRTRASRWQPRILLAGLITEPLQVLGVVAMRAAGLGVTLGVIVGAMAGGATAVLLIPGARSYQVILGSGLTLAVFFATYALAAHHLDMLTIALALGFAFLALFSWLGALIGRYVLRMLALRASPLPEAREIDR